MSDEDFLVVPPGAPSSDEKAYSEDGVDLTLIRWMLSLTPAERLRELQRLHDFLEGVRAANPGWTLTES